MFCLILFVYVTLHLKYLKKLDCFIEYYFRALHCRWSRFAALFGATDSGKLRWRPQKERETDCQIIVIQHYRISKSSFILLCQKTFWWSKNSFFLFCEQWRLPLFPSHCYLFCRGECNGLSWTYFPSFQALVFLSSSLKLANLQLAICIWTCNYSFHHGSPTSIMYANDYRSSCRYTWTEVFQIHPCTRGQGWPCRRAARVWCCKEGWSAFRPPIEPTSRELKVKQNNIDQLSLSCKLLSVC